jgi:hypothetical protein
MLSKMSAQSLTIERRYSEAKMLHIASAFDGRPCPSALGRLDGDKVDERLASTELNEADLLDSPLDVGSEAVAIESQRFRKITHEQNDVIETLELERRKRHWNQCGTHSMIM